MKIPTTFQGKIDYRMQDHVYQVRRSLRKLTFRHRAFEALADARRFGI